MRGRRVVAIHAGRHTADHAACLGFLAALAAGIVGITRWARVFEGGYWLLLNPYQTANLMAALLAYRLMYHLIPLCVSGVFYSCTNGARCTPPAKGCSVFAFCAPAVSRGEL